MTIANSLTGLGRWTMTRITDTCYELSLPDGKRVLFSYGVVVAAFLPGLNREDRWVALHFHLRPRMTTNQHIGRFMGGHRYEPVTQEFLDEL